MERVELRVKSPALGIPAGVGRQRLPQSAEEIVQRYDEFGSTPPRTRIKNKYRDWDRKQKFDPSMKLNTAAAQAAAAASNSNGGGGGGCSIVGGLSRMMRSRVNRRNTMDCAILNEMFVDDDCARFTPADKRSKQLLRESERDLKRLSSLAVIGVAEATNKHAGLGDGGANAAAAAAAAAAVNQQLAAGVSASMAHLALSDHRHTTIDGLPVQTAAAVSANAAAAAAAANAAAAAATSASAVASAAAAVASAAPAMLIKCSNPYKSVSTRPVGCRTSAPATAFQAFGPLAAQTAQVMAAPPVPMGRMSAVEAATAASREGELDDGLTCQYDRTKLQVRREFHETFANLIKLGSDKQDNRASTNEIDTWQTELKDLIWLELQAWHAERTPEEQDHYLCAARRDVPQLLQKILHYRYKPAYQRASSTDSGISSASSAASTVDAAPPPPPTGETKMELNTGDNMELVNMIITTKPATDACKSCISLYCKDCQQQQCSALREVEELLTRLEAAEALYPSSQVMGNYHPIYRSAAFVGRVKAMCLWYNITKYQRLKLTLVGMLFRRLHGKHFQWPLSDWADSSASSTSSSGGSGNASATETTETADSGHDSAGSRRPRVPIIPRVKFSIDGDQNGDGDGDGDDDGDDDNDDNDDDDTVDSPASSCSDPADPRRAPRFPDSVDATAAASAAATSATTFAQFIDDVQQYRLDPISRRAAERLGADGAAGASASPYRRYIEHIMKSRGLGKSLSFLHRLHNVIIRKVQITLERHGGDGSADADGEFDADVFDEGPTDAANAVPIDREQEEELRRYGAWSPEALALELPSYAPTFVFLSVIPLEIMHEYLRMRIESRPQRPNPLSLEQLLKEVREGLILAMTHRERFNKHVHTALDANGEALARYMTILDEYDATVSDVMAMYLDYVEQWVLEATPEQQQKSAVVREWSFAKLCAPMIYGQHAVAAVKFCEIVGRILQAIGKRLKERIVALNQQMIEQAPGQCYDQDRDVVLMICREMQQLFTQERENAMRVLHFARVLCRDLEQPNFHRDHELCDGERAAAGAQPATPAPSPICELVRAGIRQLHRQVLLVRHTLVTIVEHVHLECNSVKLDELEETDRAIMQTRTREILHQSFRFGFDYHKELVRLFDASAVAGVGGGAGTPDDEACDCEFNLSLGLIHFAKMWMTFVTTSCERGRGVRPRWAAQGLEFLISACDPANTKHLTERDFDDLKAKMDACISHVVGKVPELEKHRKRASPRRKMSPTAGPAGSGLSPRLIADEQRQWFQQLSVREETAGQLLGGAGGSSAPSSPMLVRKQRSCVDGPSRRTPLTPQTTPQTTPPTTPPVVVATLRVPGQGGQPALAMRKVRIRDTVKHLDLTVDERLRARNLIGQVKTLNATDKVQIRARSVNFRWHRGIKIGQGRFGKVYTAVNNSTGELMAMKEITIQPNETRAIKNVADELKIFEGISHRYLVKYYGIELHREELLIFMELCAEGTLESLVELSGPLHEGLTRRFTAQLLTAVEELHKHGVVHRDIKTANIFLTNGGNCLKLGDFGSAVKIQAHTTVPGELKGYVGTQAYMAPEVFTKTNSDGHGRASDIWSTGCVTIEMASGKRPWAQFDSNFQIMFKVGMGETPEVPADLSAEGQQFLEHCLEHDAKRRWTASELLRHNFCKVDLDECDEKGLKVEQPRRRKISQHQK